MGNCIHTCLPRSHQKQDVDQEHNDGKSKKQERREVFEEEEEKVREKREKMNTLDGQVPAGKCKEVSEAGKVDGKVMRVKVVLTKEELQWLMMQLNSGNGEKRLENMLEEILRGRKKQGGSGNGWKPSLESIVEIPECLEMDTSIRL